MPVSSASAASGDKAAHASLDPTAFIRVQPTASDAMRMSYSLPPGVHLFRLDWLGTALPASAGWTLLRVCPDFLPCPDLPYCSASWSQAETIAKRQLQGAFCFFSMGIGNIRLLLDAVLDALFAAALHCVGTQQIPQTGIRLVGAPRFPNLQDVNATVNEMPVAVSRSDKAREALNTDNSWARYMNLATRQECCYDPADRQHNCITDKFNADLWRLLLMLCTDLGHRLKLSKFLLPPHRLDKRTHRLQSSRNGMLYQVQKLCKAQQTCGNTFPITAGRQTALVASNNLPGIFKPVVATATTRFATDITGNIPRCV
ncbi:hypothetical protein PG999_005212 [Apiospora kogelbergensis]|uniref:Uncharacterized protein n=1 Tax=Apiospora kogelbergensis TaxID=1337665 RepID=A0AAW0R1F7_9PEZI